MTDLSYLDDAPDRIPERPRDPGREYPILFRPEMVREILRGGKTETRRVTRLDTINKHPDAWTIADRRWGLRYPASEGRYYCGLRSRPDRSPVYTRSPYGGPGDILWVRETHALEDNRLTGHSLPPEYGDWRPVLWEEDGEDTEDGWAETHTHPARLWEEDGEDTEDGWAETWSVVHYKATDPPPNLCCESPRCRVCRDDEYGPHWRPSIHLPRWACGLLLRVLEVRLERLREIDDAGTDAEVWGGRYPHDVLPDLFPDAHEASGRSLVECFGLLWDSIYGDRASWAANPWVWVVRFEPIRDELWTARTIPPERGRTP